MFLRNRLDWRNTMMQILHRIGMNVTSNGDEIEHHEDEEEVECNATTHLKLASNKYHLRITPKLVNGERGNHVYVQLTSVGVWVHINK